jgi:RNA polymerase sigma-70 factor (ECF subfamily)
MSLTANPIVLNNLGEVADCDLVSRALVGREDDFEELVRRYQRPIAAYVYRMVGDYEAALDLSQEVFIKVYNSLRSYRPEYKFSTWIYRIGHNAAIDYLRRQGGRGAYALTGEIEGEPYDLPLESGRLSPEQEYAGKERREEIEYVIRQLPAAYRELVILRHSHDMSYDEIVEVTGLPLGTVKNRLFRAREAMRQQFILRGITGL